MFLVSKHCYRQAQDMDAFAYGVSARVLDEKLKREKQEKVHPSHSTPGTSRKRARGI